MIFFSKSNLAFYNGDWKNRYESSGTWPEDSIELTDEEVKTYQGKQPPAGKRLGADENGRPVWVDIPPLPKGELQKQKAVEEHQWVKSELEFVDNQLKYHWTGDLDRSQHTEQAWKDYAIALRNYTTTDVDGNPQVVGDVRPSIEDFITVE